MTKKIGLPKKAPANQAEDTSLIERGIMEAKAEVDPDAAKKEVNRREIEKKLAEIKRVREFDDAAYEQQKKDRAFAAGDSSFETAVNVIGSFIETWCSVLYAKDPSVDVEPSESTPEDQYENARRYSNSMEAVLTALFSRANVKLYAEHLVRDALSCAVSYLKVTWNEKTEQNPIVLKSVNDLQDNLNRLRLLINDYQEKGKACKDEELKMQEIERQVEAMNQDLEVLVSRGIVVQHVDMQHITISDAVPTVTLYLDAPWISHKMFIRRDKFKEIAPDYDPEELKKATYYKQIKPVTRGESVALTDAPAQAMYTEGGDQDHGFLCIEEMWDNTDGHIYTMLHGAGAYVKQPYMPKPATTRFYGFFQLAFTKVAGRRWPQSLVQKSAKLQEDRDRARSGLTEHRRRAKPKMLFHAGLVTPAGVKQIQNAGAVEYVPVRVVGGPKTAPDITKIFQPAQYPVVDMGLYDVSQLDADLEMLWGMQDAMSGSVKVAKTAREAEIQQTGTKARASSKEGAVETLLADIAQYMAEICANKLEQEDVDEMAGIGAVWIKAESPNDLRSLIKVNIAAGSSGKPNTAAEREEWGATLPMLQTEIDKIGALLMSSPQEMAKCHTELLKETVSRSGQRLDINRFLPRPGQPVPMLDPQTGQTVLAYPAQEGGQPVPMPGAPQPGDMGPNPGAAAPPSSEPMNPITSAP